MLSGACPSNADAALDIRTIIRACADSTTNVDRLSRLLVLSPTALMRSTVSGDWVLTTDAYPLLVFRYTKSELVADGHDHSAASSPGNLEVLPVSST